MVTRPLTTLKLIIFQKNMQWGQRVGKNQKENYLSPPYLGKGATEQSCGMYIVYSELQHLSLSLWQNH